MNGLLGSSQSIPSFIPSQECKEVLIQTPKGIDGKPAFSGKEYVHSYKRQKVSESQPQTESEPLEVPKVSLLNFQILLDCPNTHI